MKYLFLFSLLFFSPAISSAQNANTPADKFMSFLNNYQVDSLQVLLSDNFKVTRTFVSYSHDRAAFFNDYLVYSKEYNAEFKILERTVGRSRTFFLVEDKSDYFTYLGITYPTWKISILVHDNKVEEMRIDTTIGYSKYNADSKVKEAVFNDWLKEKYPAESRDDYKTGDGMLMRRMKEYYESKK
jgi:hypothetical protein